MLDCRTCSTPTPTPTPTPALCYKRGKDTERLQDSSREGLHIFFVFTNVFRTFDKYTFPSNPGQRRLRALMVVEMGKGEGKMAATNGQGGWLPPVQSHIKHYSVPAPVHPYIISSTFYISEQMTHEPFNSKFYLYTK